MTHDAAVHAPTSKYNFLACATTRAVDPCGMGTRTPRSNDAEAIAHLLKDKFTVSLSMQCRVQIAFCESCDIPTLFVAVAALAQCA
jgi:hypothetical protein